METGRVPTEEEAKAMRLKFAAKEAERHFRENGKCEINNLLWCLLPPWVTLAEAEELACRTTRDIERMFSEGNPAERTDR